MSGYSTDSGDGLQAERWWQRYRARCRDADEHRLQVFVRSLSPVAAHEQRTELLDALERADEQGDIDSYDLDLLGDELCLCTRCQQVGLSSALSTELLAFSSWYQNGMQSTGFTERTVDSAYTGDQYRTLVPPETAVGIYLDDTLAGVFPCLVDGTHYDVLTFLRTVVQSTDRHHEDSKTRL